MNIPWICGGDFNEIVHQEEKWDGVPRDHNQMQLFHDVIDKCQFMDLGYVGPKFTWAKHYVDGHSIRIRLDRWLLILGSKNFQELGCITLIVCQQITLLY